MSEHDPRPSVVSDATLRWGSLLNRLAVWQLSAERWVLEVMLTLSSSYAAIALATVDPGRGVWPGAYALPTSLPGSEIAWAIAFSVGAVCKIAGLMLCTWKPPKGFILRCIGLAISASLWATLGLARLMADPHTLFGAPILLLGVSSWWLLLRSPSVRR